MNKLCTFAFVFFAFHATGCMQTENSSALDGDRYGNIDGSAAFLAARAIFSASCSASGCHPDFASNGESWFKESNRLIPGNPEGSTIYNWLQNSSGNGPKTMPKDAPPLSAEKLQVIYDWIQNAAL